MPRCAPTWKERYPLIPIERYASLRRPDGTYVFPGCLAPVRFADGVGTHVEPNVWVLHRI
ncbi:MAG TPA: hypothetical protein VMK83_11935 [Gaiellaceae bacterium]|nr:hypothetical protein [Gaiellaceae bacterium]